jgi:putative phosphoribosyl transferase
MPTTMTPAAEHAASLPWPVKIETGDGAIAGDLTVPAGAQGIVIFAYGSGSGRISPRNRAVADVLAKARLATLLLDLLTEAEERIDHMTAELRFDIPFLTRRVTSSIDWVSGQQQTAGLNIGLFGASTGAAAALMAAAERPQVVRALVSRGGRPDLAESALEVVTAPTLLIVGGRDRQVIELNRQALDRLTTIRRLEIVPGATHLFEEPGTLDAVSRLATDWFLQYLP